MCRKIAVIDVGSNSVRLMLVADGKILYKRTVITRLGEGLALSGVLQKTPMLRTAGQISAFMVEAKAFGATDFYAYATAAVRSSKNGEEFVKEVENSCGIKLLVLSGEEEAKVGIVGALGNQDGALLDVGGASSELIIQKDQKTLYQTSLDVGVVRLKDTCGRDKQTLTAFCREKVTEYALAKDKIKGLSLCAIGGTATTLAALALGLETYDGGKVTGTELSKQCLEDLTDRLFRLSVEETAALPCVDEKRAQVIAGGALWLSTVVQYLGVDGLTVSDSDNLEGFAKINGWL